MEELLRDIAHHALQDRTVALIQNGSWAPASGKLMAQILGEMKNMELLEQTVTLKSALAPGQDQELEALADALAASVRGEQEAPGAGGGGRPKAKGYLQDLRLHLRVGHPAGGLPVPHLRPSGL